MIHKNLDFVKKYLILPTNKLYLIKISVSTALIAGLLLSSKLWLSSRYYPLTPVVDFVPKIAYPFDYIVYIALILLLAEIAIRKQPKILTLIFVVIFGFLLISDQSRWQPWVYQYFFIILALLFYYWKNPNKSLEDASLNTIRLITASIYFWGGFQKINYDFIFGVFPEIVSHAKHILPLLLLPLLAGTGVIIPLIEVCIGILLITNKFRKVGTILAVLMSAFILLTLGPLGSNSNSVIWPWNIFMAVSVIILFWDSDVKTRDIIWPQKNLFHEIVIILFVIMPFLSFFNMWDSYLSSALYSGNTNTKNSIFIDDAVLGKLPPYLTLYVRNQTNHAHFINVMDWSFGEMNVPVYPETRIYKNVARQICKYSNGGYIVLSLSGKPTIFNQGKPQELYCSEL